MKFKAVVFDLDGTLIDTVKDIGYYINVILKRYSCPVIPDNTVFSIVGWGLKDAMFKALPENKRDPDFVQKCADELVYEYSLNPVIHTYIYKGIPELLDYLKKKSCKIAVFSNKAHPVTERIVDILFGRDFFDDVRGAVDKVEKKPDPEGVYLIKDKIGISLSDILFVGDSDVDVMTAKNAGLDCVSVLWGYRTRKQLEDAGADIFINTPGDLYNYF